MPKNNPCFPFPFSLWFCILKDSAQLSGSRNIFRLFSKFHLFASALSQWLSHLSFFESTPRYPTGPIIDQYSSSSIRSLGGIQQDDICLGMLHWIFFVAFGHWRKRVTGNKGSLYFFVLIRTLILPSHILGFVCSPFCSHQAPRTCSCLPTMILNRCMKPPHGITALILTRSSNLRPGFNSQVSWMRPWWYRSCNGYGQALLLPGHCVIL